MYGFLLGVTSIFSILFAEKIIKKQKLGITSNDFWNLILIIFLLSITGGRIYHVLDLWEVYSKNIISIFYLWNGGMGIFGSIIFVTIFLLFYSRVKKRNIFLYTDLLCFFTPFLQIAGRVGNYFNKELPGARIEIPLLLIFIIIEFLQFKKIKFGKGTLTGSYLIFYGSIRVIVEMFRTPDNSYIIKGNNVTDILAILLSILGLGIVLKVKKQSPRLRLNVKN